LCLGFRVLFLWFRVYKNLVNSFNKHLNKCYKILLKLFHISQIPNLDHHLYLMSCGTLSILVLPFVGSSPTFHAIHTNVRSLLSHLVSFLQVSYHSITCICYIISTHLYITQCWFPHLSMEISWRKFTFSFDHIQTALWCLGSPNLEPMWRYTNLKEKGKGQQRKKNLTVNLDSLYPIPK